MHAGKDCGIICRETLIEKRKKLSDIDAKWHFIGHLQRNKAKDAPKAEDYFLAKVDSVELLGTDRSVIDATKVSPANSYIFLQPKEYSMLPTVFST